MCTYVTQAQQPKVLVMKKEDIQTIEEGSYAAKAAETLPWPVSLATYAHPFVS